MRKMTILLCLILFISCNTATESQPYEATWLEITETDSGYVVYNYPSLFNEGKTIAPMSITIRNDSLIWITFSDDIGKYYLKENEIVERQYGSYYFPVGNNFKFEWYDKEKHIARWTIYYGNEKRIMTDYLYINSAYNTFPIVNYQWDRSLYDTNE